MMPSLRHVTAALAALLIGVAALAPVSAAYSRQPALAAALA